MAFVVVWTCTCNRKALCLQTGTSNRVTAVIATKSLWPLVRLVQTESKRTATGRVASTTKSAGQRLKTATTTTTASPACCCCCGYSVRRWNGISLVPLQRAVEPRKMGNKLSGYDETETLATYQLVFFMGYVCTMIGYNRGFYGEWEMTRLTIGKLAISGAAYGTYAAINPDKGETEYIILADAILNVLFLLWHFASRFNTYHYIIQIAFILAWPCMVGFGIAYLVHDRDAFLWWHTGSALICIVSAFAPPGDGKKSIAVNRRPGGGFALSLPDGLTAEVLRPPNDAGTFGW